MFSVTSTEQRPIAANLLQEAQRKEERSPGLHVLAAREFRYPIQQQKVVIKAQQFHKINLLEKFILRAYIEISPPPSREELAAALGLDPVFVRNTFNDLIALQNISNTKDSLYVTEEGKKSFSSDTIAEGLIYSTWYLIQDTILGTTFFSRQPLDEVDADLEDLSPYVKKDLTQFPAFNFNPVVLQSQFQKLGLDFHNPDEGRSVTEMAPEAPELRWKRMAIFVLYDALCENADKAITIQARSENRDIPLVGEWLESLVQEQDLSLKTLCGLSDQTFAQEEGLQSQDSTQDSLVEERLGKIRQQASNQLRLKVAGRTLDKDVGTATQLRDVEIRPAFLQALQNACEQIIIYSPWINEQVVDDAFLSLLEKRVQQGVRILIGYGIGREEGKEERTIPQNLPQRLRNIQTAEGTPGIIAEWLGNSHAKEIVIDRSIHFSGSHNWLSYRGDRLPRGETVYQVTIATEVEKAYNHLAQRFIERAQVLWSKTTDGERSLALCILGYLDHEQEALKWIQRNRCYHLIPLWLKLAHQAISTGHEARILAPLHTVIALCCTAIGWGNPLNPEIVEALQRVLTIMRRKSQEVATVFMNDCAPELEQLGLG
jgi:hypothetical protein